MRTVSRALVASSLTVPLLFGGAGAALAGDYDSGKSGKESGHSWQKLDFTEFGDQRQSNSTEQSNTSNTTIYQVGVNVGNDGDAANSQSAQVENHQSNSNSTEQSQSQG